MIPVSLKLKNFTSYGSEPLPLDLSQVRLAAITGNNGAGKSSLLDAMTWSIWGWSRSGDDADKLIKIGQTQMAVEYEFDLDGTRYKIIRQRKKGKPGTTALELFATKIGSDQWVNLTEGRIKDTQEKIINVLHLNYDTFSASSYLRQGNADEFTRQTPNKRKEILSQILGLENYDELADKAKEKVKDINIQIQTLEYQLVEIDRELALASEYESKKSEAETQVMIAEANRIRVGAEIKELQSQKEALITKHENFKKIQDALSLALVERDKIVAQGRERAERIRRVETLLEEKPAVEAEKAELEKLRTQYESLSLIQEELLKLQTQRSSLAATVAAATARIEELNKEIKRYQEQITSLNQAVAKCPTCGSELNKEHKDKTATTLSESIQVKTKEKEAIDVSQAEENLARLDEKIKSLAFDDSSFNVLKSKLAREALIKNKWEEIIRADSALETENKAKTELAELYRAKAALIKDLEDNLRDTPDVSTMMTEVNRSLTVKEMELTTAEREEKTARDLLTQMVGLVQRSTQLSSDKENKLKTKNELAERKELYDELIIAFGKRGIQAMIIEQAIPEIEEEANKILEKLTEGNLSVTFETQRENKSGGLVETLDIIIADPEGSRSYEMYSGGEAFRVNFAVRLAISKLLTHRAGAKLQFLIIDEGFGTQDVQGRERLIEAISLIKNDFEKILVITHVEELKEAFPDRIEVTKGPDGSRYQIYNS